jgi:hypothetical protein
MTPVGKAIRLFGPSLVVGLVAPFVFPPLRRAARPVAKELLKGGLLLTESLKEAAIEARDQLSDLLAEVKAEREREAAQSESTKNDGA